MEMEDADDRILNEVYGWVNRCATQSAAHDQDYIVTKGTAVAMAGSFSRFEALAAAAIFCGYFTEVMITVEGEKRKAFKLVEEEDLFHMILKADKDWTAQRQADNRDLAKTGPVRLRDGDACRYCGRVVGWGADRKSVRWGSIDHVVPGEPGTVATMVVCCGQCNSKRKNDPNSIWKTLPIPPAPHIGPATAEWLTEKCGIPTKPTYTRTPTESVSPAPVNGPQVFEEPPAVEQPTVAAPANDEATEATPGPSSDSNTGTPDGAVENLGATEEDPAPEIKSEIKTDHGLISDGESGRSGYAGSGRDGTGWVGSGGAGSGAQLPASRDPASNLLRSPNPPAHPKPNSQVKKKRSRTRPRKRK